MMFERLSGVIREWGSEAERAQGERDLRCLKISRASI